MRYVEVVINAPLRRPSARVAAAPAPSEDDDGDDRPGQPGTPEAAEPVLQTLHYHLPADLEERVQPGHLVWAPLGKRTVQGVVVRLADSSPVPTRAVLRLARPEPVLNATQLRLAAWIAQEYVAPTAEAIKLLLPPGLLQRSPDKLGVQARRQTLITLVMPVEEALAVLESQTRSTPALRVLQWFAANPGATPGQQELISACGLKSAGPIETLVKQGMLARASENDDAVLRLAATPERLAAKIDALRGGAVERRLVAALGEAGRALWRDELQRLVQAELSTLRGMQAMGIVRLENRVRFRDPLAGRTFAPSPMPRLTGEQASAWSIIAGEGFARPADSGAAMFLLHGVTGSGKTEIYLRAIAEALAHDRQAIVLIPEIALAPQTVERFAGRFPGRVTVIHSALSQGERYDVWRALRNGEFDVVMGPRSALFAPMPRLGLIVIDEEHESAYKQDSEEWGSLTVFYDARTVARRLAEMTGSVLISGSATPSLETYARAMRGEATLLTLPRRVVGHQVEGSGERGTGYGEQGAGNGERGTGYGEQGAGNGEQGAASGQPALAPYHILPPVEIVDMRQELRAGNRSVFSRSLQAELHATLEAGEQAILFLNRRGAHTFIMCRDCGHVEQCPRCEVPLVYHERSGVLLCHHCERSYPVPAVCPQCGSRRIRFFGTGTEQVEQRIREIAPLARLLRWDADTASGRGSHERILARFRAHEADVLVGTQMIAKGLDLPLVTLVGVVAADVGLHLPDFRAAERTFQLLTQVAGRAGRSARGGRVVIQSYTPEHYAIQSAAQHDYHTFYRREMAFRREHEYPPVRRMARLVLWEKNPKKAQDATRRMALALRALLEETGLEHDARLLGPAPAFFARSRGYYRWQLLLSADDPPSLLRRLEIPFGWRVDVDPVSVL